MGKQQLFLRNHGLKASKISGKVQHFAESFSSSHRAPALVQTRLHLVCTRAGTLWDEDAETGQGGSQRMRAGIIIIIILSYYYCAGHRNLVWTLSEAENGPT